MNVKDEITKNEKKAKSASKKKGSKKDLDLED
jgi:hypothetical protein